MATAALTLNTWKVEYYETMAAAERAQLKTKEFSTSTFARHAAGFFLLIPFKRVNSETEKLGFSLERLESFPSAILLEEDAMKIPDSLNELFKTMCVVIQRTELLGLHKVFFLKKEILRLREHSEKINGFAVRYKDAQTKLRSRVSQEDVPNYHASFTAYATCALQSEQATEDDVKSELLHL